MIFLGAYLLLNMEVSTHYGTQSDSGYALHHRKIPLYLKSLEFITRHFQLKQLTRDIIEGKVSDQEKIDAIFKWVTEHIKLSPAGMPAIDDHHWNIIVRGYGAEDQMSDVFSVLCFYSDIKSFYRVLRDNKGHVHPFAFVFFKDKWIAFDVCHHAYFINVLDNDWASLSDLEKGLFHVMSLDHAAIQKSKNYYCSLFSNVEVEILDTINLERNLMQQPLTRLWYEIMSFFKIKVEV